MNSFKNSSKSMAANDTIAALFIAYTQCAEDEVDNEDVNATLSTSTQTPL